MHVFINVLTLTIDLLLIGNLSFSEFFSPSRFSQDSIRVCFLERKNIVVTFLFNPSGVKASPYCSDPRSPDNSDEEFSHFDELGLPHVTLPYFIQFSLLPKAANFKKIVGGLYLQLSDCFYFNFTSRVDL